MIVVVDYKKGNLKSVERGLAACGADVLVSDSAADIARADAVVLPGVGAFTDAMRTLEETGQASALRSALAAGKPFLGICLGMHLMFEAGEEHAAGAPTPGLGFLPGVVGRIPAVDDAGVSYKVPHVGWNTVTLLRDSSTSELRSFAQNDTQYVISSEVSAGREVEKSRVSSSVLFEGIPHDAYFYFTHSYVAPESAYTIARTTHACSFPSAVAKGNAFGVQFHPEKSSDVGARMLRNFVDYCK